MQLEYMYIDIATAFVLLCKVIYKVEIQNLKSYTCVYSVYWSNKESQEYQIFLQDTDTLFLFP